MTTDNLEQQLADMTRERDAFRKQLNQLLGCESCPGLPKLAASEDVADEAFRAVFFDRPEIANKPTNKEVIAQLREELAALSAENEALEDKLRDQCDYQMMRQALDDIEDELEDVDYTGPYASGIKMLKEQLALAELRIQSLTEALEELRDEFYRTREWGCLPIVLLKTQAALSTPVTTEHLEAWMMKRLLVSSALGVFPPPSGR